jgi:tetratricopeptide (TPR) repeat protein
MPRHLRNENYRQGFTEVFEYFERLPDVQKVRQGKDWDDKIGSPPYNTLKAYQLGRLPTNKNTDAAQSKPVIQLVNVLIERKILKPEVAIQFARDLSDGLSIIRYLPPIIEIAPPQPALLLKQEGHLSELQRYLPEHYVGYDDQQQHIIASIKTGRRVVLQGQPGAGKSSLAVCIVKRYLQENDGKQVLWMDTGYGSTKQVEAIIHVTLRQGSDLEIALRSTNIGLLVLDNVWNEDLIQWINDLPRGLQVLITSREPLRIERRDLIRLNGLKPAESLELLGKYADTSFVGDPDAARLCEKIGYLPLALKVAGSQLAEKQQTPGDIANNLIQIVHDRVGSNVTYALLIEQNFRSSSIDPNHREDVRSAFRAFGALFNRQMPAELLQQYQASMGKQRNEIGWSLENYLTRQNIVQKDNSFYHINDVIYALSSEQCTARERWHGVKACIEYVNKQIRLDNRAGFAAIWLVRQNLLGAMPHALTIAREEQSQWFEDVLWLLASRAYFDAKGYSPEWLNYLKIAAQQAEERQDFNRAHYFWAKIGNGFALYREKLPDALAAYNRAFEFAPDAVDDDPVVRQAISLSLIGVTHARLGNPEQADQYFDHALRKGKDHPLALSQIFEHMGRYAAELKDDMDEARRCFEESLQQAKAIMNDLGRWYDRCFYAYINLGEVEHLVGNNTCALEHIEQAVQFAEKSNKDDLRARAAREMGEKLMASGELNKAGIWLEQALDFYERVDDEENEQEVRELIKESRLISQ